MYYERCWKLAKILNIQITGKALWLDDIIDHIERKSDYYTREANLSYLVGEQQHRDLFDAFRSAGYL